jgi:hypothetical protein
MSFLFFNFGHVTSGNVTTRGEARRAVNGVSWAAPILCRIATVQGAASSSPRPPRDRR